MDKIEQDFSSLLPKDKLNPSFWEDGQLRPEVRSRLAIIAVEFAKEAKIDLSLLRDIILTGSSANCNWSQYSDVDLHLVVEYDDFSDNSELIKDYFSAKKSIWNTNHNITILGHEVEVYIQDEDEPHYASGVFSLKHNKWLHKPEHISIENIDKRGTIHKVKVVKHLIHAIQEKFDNKEYQETYDSAKRLKEKIRKMRKHGLEENGEFSTENLAFKLLRRTDALEHLDNLYKQSYDKMRSLEN